MNKIGLVLLILFTTYSFTYGGLPAKYSQEISTLKKLRDIEQTIATNPEAAITDLDGIIRYAINQNLDQSMSLAYLLMGRSYKELQQPKIALHFLKLAETSYEKPLLKLKSKSRKKEEKIVLSKPPVYYQDLATVYVQLGNYKTANKEFKRYQGKIKDQAEAERVDYLIAQNLYAMEEFKQAIAAYETLLNREKSNTNQERMSLCYSRLAACYISLGETEKGLTFYKLSTQGIRGDNSSLGNGYTNQNVEIVSKALRKQNKLKEALSVRQDAANAINDGLEQLRLAQLHYQSDDLEKAELSLDKYFQQISYDLIDQNEIEVIKQVALVLSKQQKNEKALQYIIRYEALSDTIVSRLASLASKAQKIGEQGSQNVLQLNILQKDKEMSENTINHLMRENELREDIVVFQKTMIYSLCVVILLGLITLLYIIRVSRQRRIANQQLALRSLRSQMNPHFIFNALNSVNSFISMSDERSANRFLSEFSTLMRTVMENSEHDFIPLTKELEIINIYMELEHFRFQDKFSYQLIVKEELDEEAYVLPPMLIQPYIENAIWHGLRYKETKGELVVTIGLQQDKLKVLIQDNGIGRKKSQEIKTKNQKKNKSTALKNIGERVELFNNLHNLKVEVAIQDLNDDGSGTVVTILIPQPKHG